MSEDRKSGGRQKNTESAADKAKDEPIDVVRTNEEDNEEPLVHQISGPDSRRGFLKNLSSVAAAGVAAAGAVAVTTDCKNDSTTGPSGGGSTSTSSSTSSTTTTAAQSTFTLSGEVIDSDTRRGIGGATVKVKDGPNANRSVETNSNGRYSMGNLTRSGFTVRATKRNYNYQEKGVTLNRNVTLNFELQPESPGTTTTSTGGGGGSHYWYPC